jgi:hypothetical protein
VSRSPSIRVKVKVKVKVKGKGNGKGNGKGKGNGGSTEAAGVSRSTSIRGKGKGKGKRSETAPSAERKHPSDAALLARLKVVPFQERGGALRKRGCSFSSEARARATVKATARAEVQKQRECHGLLLLGARARASDQKPRLRQSGSILRMRRNWHD